MNAIDELRGQGKMTWIEEAHGWIAAPEDIVDALGNEGFVECKRATTTSRRDLRPTGGVWQGVNRSTGFGGLDNLGGSHVATGNHRVHHD
jgi:hypothetical protein